MGGHCRDPLGVGRIEIHGQVRKDELGILAYLLPSLSLLWLLVDSSRHILAASVTRRAD